MEEMVSVATGKNSKEKDEEVLPINTFNKQHRAFYVAPSTHEASLVHA